MLILCLPVFLIFATVATIKPRLYVIGDSTSCIYSSSQYPRTGWAQILQNYFDIDSVIVADNAQSGRSSKSFYDEGHWAPIKNELRKGDYVIIQFGHNDEKTDDATRGTLPGTTFKQYLSIYIDDAVAKGAIPILATPMERNSWSGAKIQSTHVTADGDYPQAVRDLAAAKKTGLIDATALTKAFFEKIGKDSTTRLFLNLAAGESPNYPSGNSDNTHLQERGAKAIAQLMVGDIARQKIQPLSAWIKGSTTPSAQSPETWERSFARLNHRPALQTTNIFGGAHGRVPIVFDFLGRSATFRILSGHDLGNGVRLLRIPADGKEETVTILLTGKR